MARQPGGKPRAAALSALWAAKVCYLRDGGCMFETYWTTGRGCEAMGNSYGMLDMTVYGRQEPWAEHEHRAEHRHG